MMTPPEHRYAWIAVLRARGVAAAFGVLLDVVAPLGVLAAQMLWVAQPLARALGGEQMVIELAQALEDPAELAQLQALLAEPPDAA